MRSKVEDFSPDVQTLTLRASGHERCFWRFLCYWPPLSCEVSAALHGFEQSESTDKVTPVRSDATLRQKNLTGRQAWVQSFSCARHITIILPALHKERKLFEAASPRQQWRLRPMSAKASCGTQHKLVPWYSALRLTLEMAVNLPDERRAGCIFQR